MASVYDRPRASGGAPPMEASGGTVPACLETVHLSSHQRTLLVGLIFAILAALFIRAALAVLPASSEEARPTDAAIEDAAIEDAAIEDAAIEDAAIEDAMIADASSGDLGLEAPSNRVLESRQAIHWLLADSAVGYRELQRDAAGKLVRRIDYIGPGPDGRWFSDDDALGSWVSYQSQGGLLTRAIPYVGTGPDGHWFSDDDQFAGYVIANQRVGDELLRERYVVYAGADGRWFNEDDIPGYERRFSHQGGRLVEVETRGGAGSDGVWGSDDDPIREYWRYDYDTAGDLSQAVHFVHDAGDGRWHTGDDIIGGWVDFSRAGNDFSLLRTEYGAAGTDGQWFTDDDLVTEYSMARLDPLGREALVTLYGSQGLDNRWFTADDEIVAQTQAILDANDQPIQSLWLSTEDLLPQVVRLDRWP